MSRLCTTWAATRGWTAVAAAACWFATAGAAADAPAVDAIEAELGKLLDEMDCPGALVGVFPDGGAPWRSALGVADTVTREPMRLDMRMRIGSVSKLFVGTAVLRLVDRGALSLDAPISRYVDGVPRGDEITLRMLGQHTSGLGCPIFGEPFQKAIVAEPRKLWPVRDVLLAAYAMPLRHEPGKAWRYSNTSAVLLGLAAEKVTDQPIGDVIDQQVCRPLGLRGTGVCASAAPPPPTPSAYRHGKPGHWIGYGDEFVDVTGYSASWAGVAGDMFSTLADLGVAATALATGTLLSEESKRELFAWRETSWSGVESGFLINRNARGVGHEGNVPGFEAVVRRQADRRRAIVVLTNLSNNADKTMPAERLFDRLVETLDSRAGAAND